MGPVAIRIPLYYARRRRMAELLAALCALSLADLVFTLWAHFYTYTTFHEMNPFARSLLQQQAIPALVVAKLAMTAVGAGIFWMLRRDGRAEAALWCILTVYVLLAVRWSKYTSQSLVPDDAHETVATQTVDPFDLPTGLTM